MRVTNIHGVPETISRALIKQESFYDAGAVDSSVTQLIQPPRITILRKKHFKEMTRDVTESFWALLGSGVHYLLELGATDNMIVEERLFMTIDGWKISGQLDVQEIDGPDVDIIDYKVTSYYSLTGDEPKAEWVEQLNLQCLLLDQNKPNLNVRSLTICCIIRDWSGATARRDPFYPQAPIQMVDIPIWSKQKQLNFARTRIAAHRQAKFDAEMDEPLEFCTREERWMKAEKWAVLKKGGKRALKVCTSEEEALALVAEKGTDYCIEYREGVSTRCGYCGVQQWCDQFAAMSNKDDSDE